MPRQELRICVAGRLQLGHLGSELRLLGEHVSVLACSARLCVAPQLRLERLHPALPCTGASVSGGLFLTLHIDVIYGCLRQQPNR